MQPLKEKQKQQRRVIAHISPNWANQQTVCWEVLSNSNLESQLGEGQCIHSPGLPLMIPGHKLMLSVYMENCSSDFTITFLQCCLCHLVSHRISLNPKQVARPPGAQEFQDLPPFFSEVPLDLLCLQTGTESRQVRSTFRGLLSCFEA